MNILLFGAPGAGKGTQSALLVERLNMKQISTGDLFRSAIKNNTELGVKAKSYMDKGALVPDDVTIGMVEEVLSKGVKDFILDGFPRNVVQAQALDGLLKKLALKIDKAIFLDVPRKDLLSRLTGRRVCRSCGAVFHVETKPTKTEGICDNCGGEVYQRNDDKEEVILSRLKTYDDTTSPMISFYKEQGKFFEIDGGKDTELVYKDLSKLLGS